MSTGDSVTPDCEILETAYVSTGLWKNKQALHPSDGELLGSFKRNRVCASLTLSQGSWHQSFHIVSFYWHNIWGLGHGDGHDYKVAQGMLEFLGVWGGLRGFSES